MRTIRRILVFIVLFFIVSLPASCYQSYEAPTDYEQKLADEIKRYLSANIRLRQERCRCTECSEETLEMLADPPAWDCGQAAYALEPRASYEQFRCRADLYETLLNCRERIVDCDPEALHECEVQYQEGRTCPKTPEAVKEAIQNCNN